MTLRWKCLGKSSETGRKPNGERQKPQKRAQQAMSATEHSVPVWLVRLLLAEEMEREDARGSTRVSFELSREKAKVSNEVNSDAVQIQKRQKRHVVCGKKTPLYEPLSWLLCALKNKSGRANRNVAKLPLWICTCKAFTG